jgi:predicted ATP-dependent endonuclease of OLD family
MSAIKIFVEGIADEKFLSDYIEHILPELAIKDYNIISAEGWGINKRVRQIMQWNTDEGGVNLVVFDADSNIEGKKKEIEKWKRDFNLSFELFLFPNNKGKGTLENLLEEIIPEQNRPILDCWEGYEKCLKSKTIKGRENPLTTPAKKTKIYGYLEALI